MRAPIETLTPFQETPLKLSERQQWHISQEDRRTTPAVTRRKLAGRFRLRRPESSSLVTARGPPGALDPGDFPSLFFRLYWPSCARRSAQAFLGGPAPCVFSQPSSVYNNVWRP